MQKARQGIALWQMYLFISLSFVLPTAFAQTEAVTITLDVRPFTNIDRINVHGVTRSSARLFLKVGGGVSETNFDSSVQATDRGEFLFANVRLDSGSNVIEVLAIDANGNQGRTSTTVTMDLQPPNVQLDPVPTTLNATVLNITGTVNEAVMITYTVTSNDVPQTAPPQSFNRSAGTFSLSPRVQQGTNVIALTFTDIAGNVVTRQQTVEVDTERIRILEHNLDQLDPSYSQEVVVRGRISKPGAEVVVFVNGESRSDGSWSTSLIDTIKHIGSIAQGQRNYRATADSEGNFRIPVFLEQRVSSREQQTYIDGSRPLDGAGINRTTYTTAQLDRIRSEFRAEREFDNTVKIVAIDRFGHTAEAEGVVRFAKCGTGGDWEIQVGDVSPAIVTPELLRLGLAQFAFSVQLDYKGGNEEDAALTASPFIRTYEWNDELRRESAIDPLQLISSSNIVTHWDEDDNYRNGYVVINLNSYNYSQKDLEDIDLKDLVIKVPLEMELNYEGPQIGGEKPQLVQRQCWDVSLALDVEVPLDKIPKHLLNESVKAIDSAIDLIDEVLKPLKVVAIVTLVTCLGSWAYLFFVRVRESLACRFATEKTDAGACSDAREKRISVERKMKLVCDRTFCPSAPTVTYHMQKNQKIPQCQGYTIHNYRSENPEQVRLDAKDFLKDKDVEQFFDDAESMGEKLKPGDYGVTEQELCLYDYIEEWDTACMGMNEFEQSQCAELGVNCPTGFKKEANRFAGFCGKKAQESGVRAICTTATTAGQGGNCFYQDSKGNWYLATEVRETQLQAGKTPSGDSPISIQNAPAASGSSRVYYDPFGNLDTQYDASGNVVTSTTIDGKGVLGVHRGYVYQSPTYIDADGILRVHTEELGKDGLEIAGKTAHLWTNGANVAIGDDGTTYINTCAGKSYDQSCWTAAGLDDPEYQQYWQPAKYFSGVDGSTVVSGPGGQTAAAIRAPTQILDQNSQNQRYVVQPSSGFIRSVQCVCLPGITGYLTLWRNILEQVKLCFQTILLTGQGKSGVCRAVLTQYVCDLVVDAIKCVVRKYGPSEMSGERRGGAGRLLGALNDAGRSVHNSIVDRYGQGNLYQAMFNERKLIHQACLFAFTGDYDLDVDALLSTGIGVPIKSEGFLYPHTRRFLNYNPLDGKAAFVYHVGVGLAAGAPLTYSVELVCSNDLSCNPQDGFVGGRCDCYGSMEKSLPITASFQSLGQPGSFPGQLDAGEVLGGEQGDIYRLAEGEVRYDKVRLSWFWQDGSQQRSEHIEKKIGQEGSKPPAECQFDVASLSFRCQTVVGRRGSVRFLSPPEPTAQYYYLGDRITLAYLAEKQSPAKENPIPKILCYEVKSESRAGTPYVIDDPENNRCYFVQQDGQFDETVIGPMTGVRIEPQDIVGRAELYRDRVTPVSAIWNTPTVNRPECADIGDVLPGALTSREIPFPVGDVAVQAGTPPQDLIFVYAGEAADPNFAPTTVGPASPAAKFLVFNAQNLDLGSPMPQRYCVSKSGSDLSAPIGTVFVPFGSRVLSFGGFHVALPERWELRQGDWIAFRYQRPEFTGERRGSLSCEDFSSKSNAADWTVTVRLLHAKPKDDTKPISATNYDPNPLHNDGVVSFQGRKQEFNVPIKVICVEKGEGKEFCPTNVLLTEECVCDAGGREQCDANEYCIADSRAFGGERRCVEYTSCSPNVPITTANSANGFCDCDGKGDNRMEYCLNAVCELTSSGRQCVVTPAGSAVGVSAP